ncbi:MAG: M20/M25/M40 family metallo-hydrolase [Clostridiales bacterium]|nr:M20/M25/M40 family metallo-hydrolase [Clostridiales bacterium]
MNLNKYKNELEKLFLSLCAIPSPTNHEDERLSFIANWYADNGLYDFEIDNQGNVLYNFNVKAYNPIKLVTAHVDTVFSSDTNIVPRVSDGVVYCPGSGDNTANLAIMMMAVKVLSDMGFSPSCGVIFAADVGEEGLGNLCGVKSIIGDYGVRIDEMIALDLSYGTIINRAVGSRRYKIEVSTKGGHSYLDFGNDNAIAAAAEIVHDLYRQNIPNGSDTTYNIGNIFGGTGVNVIASNASMLYEIRSENFRNIEVMHEQLIQILNNHTETGVSISCEIIGERPGMGNVNEKRLAALFDRCLQALKNPVWENCGYRSEFNIIPGSTDCNIPLSKGVPSLCFGLAYSENHHTLNEYTRLDSLLPGLTTLVNLFENL